jgi:hypothetical protein
MDIADETDAEERALDERIEDRIAALGDAIERCRKISLAARLLAGAGGVYLAAALFGLVVTDPPLTIAALAAVLGGVVLLGSNASTWKQTEAALAAAYAARDGARMLAPAADTDAPRGRPTLRIVGDERPTLH